MPNWAERVATDPGWRHAIEAATRAGVPLSEFLGVPRVTTYSLDLMGRPVRSETAGWSADDRGALLALMAWEADLCPGCRQPLSETSKAELDGAYVAEPAIRCHRCTASEIGAAVYEESPQRSALLIPVALRNGKAAGTPEGIPAAVVD